MGLRPEAVGETTPPTVHRYDERDVILYALGIGARAEELPFLYEGELEGEAAKGPKVFPTYAVVPAFAPNMALFEVVGGDLAGVVHGSQKIVLHRPFPPKGALTTVAKVAGVHDLRRMAQSVITTETRDEAGALIAETEWTIMYLLDGGFGGERPPRSPKHPPPERAPDWVVEERTSPEQALLYRLSGDKNPLHADPAFARRAEKVTGGRPILHGLCTYGYVGRAVLHQECGGDPDRLKSLYGRFSKPVWPGDTLLIEGWREAGRVLLRATTKERPGEVVFTHAYAEVGAEINPNNQSVESNEEIK